MLGLSNISATKKQMMVMVAMMIMIAVIPLMVTGLYTYAQIEEQIGNESLAKLSSVAVSRASDINHVMQLNLEQVKLLSGLDLLKQLDPTGAHDDVLIEEIQNEIDSIYHESNIVSGIYSDIEVESHTDVIGIWDVNGEIIVNTNRDLIGQHMPGEILEHVKEYGIDFGGLIQDPLTGHQVLLFTHAIYHETTQEFVGAVITKVRADSVNEILLNRDGLGETGELYIVNNNNMMISESRFIEDAAFNVEAKSDVIDACLQGEIFSGIYPDYRDVSILGTQIYLADQDWCLLSEVDVSEAYSSAYVLRDMISVTAIIVAVIIAGVSVLASKQIVGALMKPVKRVSKIAEKISKGDLTESIEESNSDDDLGKLTNSIHKMTGNLRVLIGETHDIATTVVKNANSVAASTEELNSGVEQVSSTVQQISTGSQSQASDLSDAKNIVDSITNNDEGTSASEKMSRIVELTKGSSEKVRGLAEKSTKITDVVEVIRGIAEKTNLLALNAAIEAARAGESGRGFAVVADEVRRLAEGSAKSSQEIDDLLREIQEEIKSTVTGIDESAKEVEAGRDVVEKSLQALENIGKKVQEISAVSEQNAAASEEASASVEQQTAATEDISTSSQSMASLAGELERKVAQFKLQEPIDNNISTSDVEQPKPKKSFKDRILKKEEDQIDGLVQTAKED